MTTPAIMVGLLLAPLAIGSALNRFAKRQVVTSSILGCLGISLVFCFTGIAHFVRTESMVEMLPPWVPWRQPLVYITGIVEIIAALAVVLPRWRSLTAMALIVMLMIFLSVNCYSTVQHIGMGGHQWGPVYLLVRVPLQLVLMGWIWWFGVRHGPVVPVRFSCNAKLDQPPDVIAHQILDLSEWPSFVGYGPLPGVKRAEFEVKRPEIVGTRIRVWNTDGSSHVEEIVEWEPERRLRLHMHEFSPPLSRLATSFYELWEFTRDGGQTLVIRSFELNARSALTRPILCLIAILLRKAIARHLNALSA